AEFGTDSNGAKVCSGIAATTRRRSVVGCLLAVVLSSQVVNQSPIPPTTASALNRSVLMVSPLSSFARVHAAKRGDAQRAYRAALLQSLWQFAERGPRASLPFRTSVELLKQPLTMRRAARYRNAPRTVIVRF